MYLDWRQSTWTIDVNLLRKDLLAPIKAEIAARGLGSKSMASSTRPTFLGRSILGPDVPAALAEHRYFQFGSSVR